MIQQLVTVDDSPAVFLGESLLEQLGWSEDEWVEVAVTDGALVITKASHEAIHKEKIRQALDRVMDEWGDVLRRLAD